MEGAQEAKRLLYTLTYDEMDERELALVVEYETEHFKPWVDGLMRRLPIEKVEDKIHERWLDYRMADGTEDNLLAYVSGT